MLTSSELSHTHPVAEANWPDPATLPVHEPALPPGDGHAMLSPHEGTARLQVSAPPQHPHAGDAHRHAVLPHTMQQHTLQQHQRRPTWATSPSTDPPIRGQHRIRQTAMSQHNTQPVRLSRMNPLSSARQDAAMIPSRRDRSTIDGSLADIAHGQHQRSLSFDQVVATSHSQGANASPAYSWGDATLHGSRCLPQVLARTTISRHPSDMFNSSPAGIPLRSPPSTAQELSLQQRSVSLGSSSSSKGHFRDYAALDQSHARQAEFSGPSEHQSAGSEPANRGRMFHKVGNDNGREALSGPVSGSRSDNHTWKALSGPVSGSRSDSYSQRLRQLPSAEEQVTDCV